MFSKGRLAVILVVTAILAATVAGVAMAMPDSGGNPAKTNLYQDCLAKFSANLGVEQDKVVTALNTTKKQMLDEAVQQGRITQEQADKMAARMGDNPGWFGFFNGPHKDGKGFGKGFGERGRKLDYASKALGITAEELKSELESGKRLPQIVEGRGMTVEQFHQKVLELKKEDLGKAVSEGKITQEEADKMIQKMEQRFNSSIPGKAN